MNTRSLLHTAAPVMPVLVIDDAATAAPLAAALAAGGLSVLEITLRTPAALDAIRAMRDVPGDLVIGAGTVTSPEQVLKVADAGGQFVVSPGLTGSVVTACRDAGLPCLPGVMTPSDVQRAIELGLDTLKFFPASRAGGTAMLSALRGPFPDVLFCPTGGIAADTKDDYLALPNVGCVGGSWVAPADAIAREDWDRVTRLAAATRQGRDD